MLISFVLPALVYMYPGGTFHRQSNLAFRPKCVFIALTAESLLDHNWNLVSCHNCLFSLKPWMILRSIGNNYMKLLYCHQ